VVIINRCILLTPQRDAHRITPHRDFHPIQSNPYPSKKIKKIKNEIKKISKVSGAINISDVIFNIEKVCDQDI